MNKNGGKLKSNKIVWRKFQRLKTKNLKKKNSKLKKLRKINKNC